MVIHVEGDFDNEMCFCYSCGLVVVPRVVAMVVVKCSEAMGGECGSKS